VFRGARRFRGARLFRGTRLFGDAGLLRYALPGQLHHLQRTGDRGIRAACAVMSPTDINIPRHYAGGGKKDTRARIAGGQALLNGNKVTCITLDCFCQCLSLISVVLRH
jgi:hypothetical protein